MQFYNLILNLFDIVIIIVVYLYLTNCMVTISETKEQNNKRAKRVNHHFF